jgi:hypothetical protein
LAVTVSGGFQATERTEPSRLAADDEARGEARRPKGEADDGASFVRARASA